RAWGRLGYPRRALRLQECAAAIVARHRGVVPNDGDALLALPGIGEYTAAAVLAFAYHRKATVVDTNVRRVLARAVTGDALPAPSYTAAERSLAAQVSPPGDGPASLWAVASMELGALVCTARSPRCLDGASAGEIAGGTGTVGTSGRSAGSQAGGCPVADLCAWRAAGYPADQHAHRRRSQAWQGTDRQMRGRIMALLRASNHPVPRARLNAEIPDNPTQLARCLASLIEDGLIEQSAVDTGGLPRKQANTPPASSAVTDLETYHLPIGCAT
ncbi:MAG: hypothetical protein LBB54_01345, partial [Cellulomonadaceae bacterium]|nr:hypothetical protein [Cellulomonadaceae bacterium]